MACVIGVMLLQQSIEHVVIVYTSNTFCVKHWSMLFIMEYLVNAFIQIVGKCLCLFENQWFSKQGRPYIEEIFPTLFIGLVSKCGSCRTYTIFKSWVYTICKHEWSPVRFVFCTRKCMAICPIYFYKGDWTWYVWVIQVYS